ncbi:hypothetical protein [uncultured Friedmanniella sp.]|uniref:hypothetical protein n=1 Tax=uncultured Friedmanniella sp. TaxID=335381 RepID=UPI0035CACC62
MVDPDPGYRPRRAFVEPADADATDSRTSAAPAASATPPPAVPADKEQPPPLFRDEVPGSTRQPSVAEESLGEQTRIVRPLTFRQRRPAPVDEDATTLLPRTVTGGRRTSVEDDDDEDEPRRSLLGPRVRLALLAGTLAAVIVVGAAIIYAVSSVGTPAVQPSTSTSVGPTSSDSGTPTADPNALLADSQLLTTTEAGQIDGDRTWKVALTQRGAGNAPAAPACLTDDPVDGEPAAKQEVLQLLSSTGKDAPSALHQATAYASPEDAAQAYALAAKAFGSCVAAGSYIAGGATVTGVGDQSAGLVVNVVTGGKVQWHSIVLSRTGRVLNVLDAARPKKSLPVRDVAAALAAVTTTQCEAAGGTCATSPEVTPGPPPLGGDVPGFLATGDLPPAGDADESWVATPAEEPSDSFLGSQCETVNWARTGATAASSRIYLIQSSVKFGLNDIVLTMKDDKAATAFAEKIRDDLLSCSKRQLTASVTDPAEVSGVGASGTTVTGWTSTVSQKTPKETLRYRVGVVASGTKVAYTFLSPQTGGYDLTDDEWDVVAVRAGQRMTQVP